ncbi:DNA polymerase III, chi subunit [Andreprevotia lacus DSM 23236]|jgi:DNA polymerase-3 subunit chi|uniref:DNA polymerase III, chi subunit n=1 Tax=Andreprevotia lacus DSM 23236 TaxID=1121001 RepID=A0A1W1Y0C2_9NEIS|nr:DNA polymerase III subunit chi [Andreprevotia lacus]SMC29575.1 DNA polymerase III, chi subunit [Andreprevotia lacus DSM 23236]
MEVTFYFNVRNREQALCQLVGKAVARGMRLNVLAGSEAAAAALDRLLWEVPQTGFIPHCAADADIAAATPVIIDHRHEKLQVRDALFNWTDGVPQGFQQYARVVEIVEQDEEQRAAARERWRAYQGHGVTPVAVDMLKLAQGGAA